MPKRCHSRHSGFDQEMAKKIGADLEERKVRMLFNTQPKNIHRDDAGKLHVDFAHDDGSTGSDEFDTVGGGVCVFLCVFLCVDKNVK